MKLRDGRGAGGLAPSDDQSAAERLADGFGFRVNAPPFTGAMSASRSDVANRMNMRGRHRHIDGDAGAATLGGGRLDPGRAAKR